MQLLGVSGVRWLLDKLVEGREPSGLGSSTAGEYYSSTTLRDRLWRPRRGRNSYFRIFITTRSVSEGSLSLALIAEMGRSLVPMLGRYTFRLSRGGGAAISRVFSRALDPSLTLRVVIGWVSLH
jgi:hypothetical protein